MLDDWLQIIDCLDINLQATEIIAPVLPWGSIARTKHMPGSYHFFTADKNFSNLWRSPDQLIASGCKVAVEPNFTTLDSDEPETVLDTIYRKRILARHWQKHGIKILVDLNVAPNHLDLALLGVPKGWKSYASRSHWASGLTALEDEFDVAVEHAGTEDLLFVVFGGSRKIAEACASHQWVHIPENCEVATSRAKPYGE